MDKIWNYIESLSRKKSEFCSVYRAVNNGLASKEEAVLELLKHITEQRDYLIRLVMRYAELSPGPLPFVKDENE